MSVNKMYRRYHNQGLEEYARNKYMSHRRLLSKEQEAEILDKFKGKEGKWIIAQSQSNYRKPVKR